MHKDAVFGWSSIIRLGLVQACLGAMVVVVTSTLNRIMVVELALAALIPGMLVGWHYLVQMIRPRMGFGADQGRRCTPWMMAGMVCLALGGCLASLATVRWPQWQAGSLGALVLAFALIGLGVSACGTSLLALMAKRVPSDRRAQAATTVWVMMIVGFALTAFSVGQLIEPYSPERLVQVTVGLGLCMVVVTALALWNLEAKPAGDPQESLPPAPAQAVPFRAALATVWRDAQARCFTGFVFVSMLGYSTQDLVLEPFAGAVFGMTPGQSTQLSGVHHSGVLAGMLLVACSGTRWVRGRLGNTHSWMLGGCMASALAMAGLCVAGWQAPNWPLKLNLVALGIANGAFSIAAIATMMRLANASNTHQQGLRMGVWGAAQAVAFGLGSLLGTVLSDAAHWLLAVPGWAYACVFLLESLMFVWAARLAVQVGRFDAPVPSQRVQALTQMQRV